jgi:hypothetical protein
MVRRTAILFWASLLRAQQPAPRFEAAVIKPAAYFTQAEFAEDNRHPTRVGDALDHQRRRTYRNGEQAGFFFAQRRGLDRLRDFVDRMPLDIVPEEASRLVVDAVRKHKLEKRVLVQSFDFRAVKAVGAIAPDAAGLLIIPWTVDKAEDRDKLLAIGVDGIITNDPGGLIVHLKAKGMR